MTKHHRVAVVFDEHAGAWLAALAARCHVWLVASEENQKAAQDGWQTAGPVADDLASGVTTFTREAQRADEALASVLELVEDHHGEFAHDPPVDEILVVGLEPTDAVSSVLRDWGYTSIHIDAEGLSARREQD